MGGRPGGHACLQSRLCTFRPPAEGRDCAGNAKGPRYSAEPQRPGVPCPSLQRPPAPSPRLVTLLSSPYWKVAPLQFLRVSGREAQMLLLAAVTPPPPRPGHVWTQILKSELPPRKWFQKLGTVFMRPSPFSQWEPRRGLHSGRSRALPAPSVVLKGGPRGGARPGRLWEGLLDQQQGREVGCGAPAVRQGKGFQCH